jgi:hypothetical protein
LRLLGSCRHRHCPDAFSKAEAIVSPRSSSRSVSDSFLSTRPYFAVCYSNHVRPVVGRRQQCKSKYLTDHLKSTNSIDFIGGGHANVIKPREVSFALTALIGGPARLGKAGCDSPMLFQWYSGDLCTDPGFRRAAIVTGRQGNKITCLLVPCVPPWRSRTTR